MAGFEEQKRQNENLEQLKDETAGREARIKARRKRQQKIDAERKRKRRLKMAKMSGIWLVILAVGLYALTWFSKDFVSWVHNLIN